MVPALHAFVTLALIFLNMCNALAHQNKWSVVKFIAVLIFGTLGILVVAEISGQVLLRMPGTTGWGLTRIALSAFLIFFAFFFRLFCSGRL